jgi:HEAT repeat protein
MTGLAIDGRFDPNATFVKKLELGSLVERQNAMLDLCIMLDQGNRPPGAEALVPSLISLLRDEDDMTRSLAVETLWRLGKAAQPAIPALVRVLGDKEGSARLTAVLVLASFEEVAVPALVQALKDKGYMVRQLAAAALGRIGPKAWTALPALREAMGIEKIDVVRQRLGRSIKAVSP